MDPLSAGVPDRGVVGPAVVPAAPPPVLQARRGRTLRRQCRQCGHRGVPIRALGLCAICDAAIAGEVHARVRRIHELFALLAEGGDLPTKRAHYDRILQEAEALQRYERRGLLTTCPPPSTLLADFRAKRAALEREPQEGRETPPASRGDDLHA